MATTEIELYLPKSHPTQRQIVTEATRFNVVACGRRWGKTTMGVKLLADPALRGQPVAWFAPTYKLLAEVWRELKTRLFPVARDKSEQEHRLELITGGVIECWSLDTPDAARGRKYARVVLDEAAMVPALTEAWQAAIRPTLTDLKGDAWFLSTPKGLNYFYQLHQIGQDALNPEWRSWHFPTVANPYMDPTEIEAARRGLPERVFAQEYLAEFIAEGTGVFRRVTEAATLDPIPWRQGHTYVAGVDWGRVNDFTVISVIDADTREQVYVDRFNQIDYLFQVMRLKTVCERYHIAGVLAEDNSMGEPLVSLLRRENLPVRPWKATNASKAAVIEKLAIALEQGALKLQRDPTQTSELLAFESERLPSGMIRYSAPEGMHDDTVIALALANLLASKAPSNGRVVDFEFTEG